MAKVKVKMLTGISGLANPAYDLPEHSYAPEEVVWLHPKLADAWIAGGIAQAVREKVVPSTPAADSQPEGGYILTGKDGLEFKQQLEAAISPGNVIDASSEVSAKAPAKSAKTKK